MQRLKRKTEDTEQQRLDDVIKQFKSEFEDNAIAHINSSFVRGGVVNPDKSAPPPSGLVIGPKKLNADEARKVANEIGRKIMLEAQQKKIASAIQSGLPPNAEKSEKDTTPVNKPPRPGVKKEHKSKLTNLEQFKEELKQMQEMRQERRGLRQQLKEQYGDDIETINRLAPSLDNPYLSGSNEYADDPTTTNLYLSGLPPDIEIQDLYSTFGTFGPLASAKILFPRSDDDKRKSNGYLSGFVAYMSRTDAERALLTMAGALLSGAEIRVSWARPPFFVPNTLRELAMPDPPSGLPFNAQPQSSDLRSFLQKYKDLPKLNMPLPLDRGDFVKDYREMLSRAVVRVVIPTERPLLLLIHRVIEFIVREGPSFEAMLMERERMNPMFRFLFDNNHPTHIYYRWKLFSVLNGEDRAQWRLERYRLFDGGSWWEPPPHALYSGGMPPQLYSKAYIPRKRQPPPPRRRPPTEEVGDKGTGGTDTVKEERKKGILSDTDRDFLEDMIRDLKPERTIIGDAMVWCIDHADCAKEIVQCIHESLDITETPLHKKISRFYLVNDILGNCGVRQKDVFYYRKFFEEHLEKIFISLNGTLEAIESRIKAEQFRQRIMMCFRMWEDNLIFTRDLLIRMQNIFLGLIKPNEQNTNDSDDEDVDGVPLNMENPLANDDEEDEDIDGIPMNIGATPVTSDTQSEGRWNDNTMSQFSSKWDAPDAFEPSSSQFHDTFSSEKNSQVCSNSGESTKSAAYEEARRKMLREVEMKVLEYQDDLEKEKVPNLEERSERYRLKLLEQMEKDLKKFEDESEGKESRKSGKTKDTKRTCREERRSRSRSSSRERDREDRRRRSKHGSDDHESRRHSSRRHH